MKMVMIGNCEDVTDLVFIGAIREINSKHLVIYLDTRYILVVSSLAIDWKGNDSNICADTMAEIIATVLDIFRLISLIDVGDLIDKERVQMFYRSMLKNVGMYRWRTDLSQMG
jgi:acetylglutamate kinase